MGSDSFSRPAEIKRRKMNLIRFPPRSTRRKEPDPFFMCGASTAMTACLRVSFGGIPITDWASPMSRIVSDWTCRTYRTESRGEMNLAPFLTSRWERMASRGLTHIVDRLPVWTHTASMRCACIRSSRNLGAASDSVGKSKRWLSAPWRSGHAAGRDPMQGNEPDPFFLWGNEPDPFFVTPFLTPAGARPALRPFRPALRVTIA